jgi:hypothetical protein
MRQVIGSGYRLCNRSIVRMEAIFFIPATVSTMAFQATAEGGDRCAVVVDTVAGIKHAPPCKQRMAHDHSELSVARYDGFTVVRSLAFPTPASSPFTRSCAAAR